MYPTVRAYRKLWEPMPRPVTGLELLVVLVTQVKIIRGLASATRSDRDNLENRW